MALSKIQSTVLDALRRSPLRERFYWTGGTLLAERFLHHRRSYDIDLFTNTPFKHEDVLPLAKEVQRITETKHLEQKKVHDRWEFFLHNHEEVRFEFVHYNFPAIGKRTQWRGITIDSLDDMVANKVMAAIERHEPKDAVDLYCLFTKKRYTLKKAIALAEKKFGLRTVESSVLSNILFTCRFLTDVRPMLYGGAQKQRRIIEDVVHYFEIHSAKAVHQWWGG